jgi:hypothetical protein
MVGKRRAGRTIVYLLEFLVFEDGGKRVIESITHRAESVEAAQNYARSVLKKRDDSR